MAREPLTRRSNDPRDVHRAERKERQRAGRFAAALRVVMETPAGRVVMAEWVRRAGIYRSIWDPSSKIHYNAGRQDFGHEMLAELLEHAPELYLEMEREQRAFETAEDRSNEAAHTPSAAATAGE
jgi:hypothetical protein